MVDYEKMNDDELRAALESEGFDEDEIEEILGKCPTKTNTCVNDQKARIKSKRQAKIKDFNALSKRNPDRGL